MSRLALAPLPLAGLFRVQRQPLVDERGFFARLFCAEELAGAGWTAPIAQINQSYTALQGAVRGMHYQKPPHAEMKLVTCLRGEVWDVAVDLRQGSPTFLQWHAEHLSADNGNALLIPPGFAHGFQVVEEGAELLYLHSAPYTPACEGALNVRDPRLAIAWPLPVQGLSARDAAHPWINAPFEGIRL